MKRKFVPNAELIGTGAHIASENVISSEPMLSNCSLQFARAAGGPLTQMCIDVVRSAKHELTNLTTLCGMKGLFPVVNVRTHALRPGERPGPPGWQFVKGSPLNYVFTVSAGISNIELLADDLEVDGELEATAEAYLKANPDSTIQMADGRMMRFNDGSLFRHMPAAKEGWRFEFTLTCSPDFPENDVLKQSQVYIVL